MFFSTQRLRLVLGMLCVTGSVVAQAASGPQFVENKSQWAAPVRFRAEVPGGSVFLTATGLVYDWRSAADLHRAHDAAEAATRTHQPAADVAVHGHAVFVDFVGASATAKSVGQQPLPAYHNYFIGSDPSRWASHVSLFEEVRYSSLYPGTDLRVYGTEKASLKYDFIVQPGAQPAAIALRYRGTDGLKLQADGTLLVHTSVTDVVEQRPYAYQLVRGQRQTVPCRYRLTNNMLRYEFPQGYDHSQPLVIDPAVVACTYSGSTGSVWGAATGYDNAGNIYTAGFAQGSGYPTTPGAYQASYQGSTDVAISKLNPTGSQLLYATYLGGTSSDEVRALRTNSAGELYVLTSTFSVDFPRTTGCYDATPNGGNDVALTHLNAAGTALLGSTYLGGSGADMPVELAVGNAGAVVVGTTSSPNFPTTSGAYDQTIGGTDLFVASLNPSMTTLQWSTFLGGALGLETSPAIKLELNGNVLVAGTTTSSDFPVTPGALRTTYASPNDAFVARLRADGGALLASTFFGALNGADAITHVDTDVAGNIVVCGNTAGTLTATPGALTTPNGRIFVAGLNNTLTAQRFLSKPLNGFSLTVQSFKVDDCGNIHVGCLSNDFGLPTVNALPNGLTGGFYTATLNDACSSILFGSYFGPASQHVHTNSHRIDEQGRLYQSYCTSGVFPTTSTAYARTSRASGLDLLVFKIDQNSGGGTSVRAAVAPVDSACAPSRVTFVNSSSGSTRFRWNFADGTAQDTTQAPAHVFQNPGTYRVRLVALGTGLACSRNDTTYVTVRVKAKPTVALPRNPTICIGGSLTLNASNPGTTYRWSTGATTASIIVTQPGKYSVVVDNGRCSTRDSTTVRLVAAPTLTPDTTGCIAGGVVLKTTAEPGSTYLWSTQATTPSIVATTSGRYTVRITQGTCVEEKVVNVTLLRPVSPPNVITPNGDGKNDTFRPSEATAIEPGTRLRVYNRWGRQVYSTDEYRNDWGAGQPAGVYYYTLENRQFCTPYVKGWLEVVK